MAAQLLVALALLAAIALAALLVIGGVGNALADRREGPDRGLGGIEDPGVDDRGTPGACDGIDGETPGFGGGPRRHG
jgi:hypothetical protein